ncbi:MAG TPA: ATP-dependent DNA helicase [Solirubrobacteraceae bacterium]|jgi:DNA helicase-2/ATP-dependent DNA helicase PcrA|nr:ATP-dependent DNA helicase [Solirubrobacteraceae bacterium]
MSSLTDVQLRAVRHTGSPLLVVGPAGSGKTTTLRARFAARVLGGQAPESLLVLSRTAAAVDAMCAGLELELGGGFSELACETPLSLAERLLREEWREAGVDPFFVLASPADRVAMLLERIDELTLRQHDIGGRPVVLMGGLIERIDRLGEEVVSARAYLRWAEALPTDQERDRERARREQEFARLYLDHDRMLAEHSLLDAGGALTRAVALLREHPASRARAHERWRELLVDDYQDLGLGALRLVHALTAPRAALLAAGDEDASVRRLRGAGRVNLERFEGEVLRLDRSERCPRRVVDAAEAVLPAPGEGRRPRVRAAPGGEVVFWRCANERSQAQAVAADLERLIGRDRAAPEAVCVLVREIGRESRAVTAALEERAIPYRVLGASAFFDRAEVRDVLAWLRLLADPTDAGAVVRALARPPVELRSLDLARVIQIARRRKLDMVSALAAATESPQLPPEARDRILGFLTLHRAATGALDTQRPEVFVHRLIERLGLRRQQLFAAHADVVERLVNLAKLGDLAAGFARRVPGSTPREFARYLAAVAESGLGEEEAAAERAPRAVTVMPMAEAQGLEFDHVYVLGLRASAMPGARRSALEPIPDALLAQELPPDSREAHEATMRRLLALAITRARRRVVLAYASASERGALQPPSPFVEAARATLGADWSELQEELFGPAENLQSTLRLLREEVLASVARIGGRLGELRLDTDLDVSHGVVRYLELLKLAALVQRPEGETVEQALSDLNARLLASVTPLQAELLRTSTLDEVVLAASADERRRAQAIAARDEPSLEPFLPRRGEGLVLSASDIETYRSCPLKYKFARVFRIPSEPTLSQRFGILVHQVLERYHGGAGGTLSELMGLLDSGWRKAGLGDSEQERQLHEKARVALGQYHARLEHEPAEPVWFERPFAFRIGAHHLRGRVDRVDRLPDAGYELIDYKTGRPRTVAQLADDVQLSLYAVAAREAWDLDAPRQSYYYVLDDEKVAVPREPDIEWLRDTVQEVAEGILSQGFEPTPSYAACALCDYRIVCPAAEK